MGTVGSMCLPMSKTSSKSMRESIIAVHSSSEVELENLSGVSGVLRLICQWVIWAKIAYFSSSELPLGFRRSLAQWSTLFLLVVRLLQVHLDIVEGKLRIDCMDPGEVDADAALPVDDEVRAVVAAVSLQFDGSLTALMNTTCRIRSSS